MEKSIDIFAGLNWEIMLAVIIPALFLGVAVYWYFSGRKTGGLAFFPGRSGRIIRTGRRLAFERMADGLVVLDNNNLILEINPAGREIFGISGIRIKNQPAQSVFGSFKELVDYLGNHTLVNQEIPISGGGEVNHYLLDISPLSDRRGDILGKILLFRNITALKQTEARLSDARARAGQADQLKTAFLANMSHEIRTPMNAIIGFSNLLNEKNVTEEERREFTGHIKSSGDALLQLIDDIIDISRLDAGQMIQENSNLSITALLSELSTYVSEILKDFNKPDIQVKVTGISKDADWPVMADGVKIKRIMRHILSNAVKFTDQGFIEIGVNFPEPAVMLLYVKDTGMGIAHEKQEMIFERFSRVTTGPMQAHSGTGMGLAICRGLAELMGGTIRVESNLGSGSTFYFTLPVTRPVHQPAPGFPVPTISRLITGIPVHAAS
jgi:PAS domain S-box-containing protein